jgi:hypothetical protein
MNSRNLNQARHLVVAAIAAFCTYFCMYAFRKPFTAATFEGQELWGFGLKTVLVVSQLVGYMLSKFIGIRVISEMRSQYRAVTIIRLILTAEAALVAFAFAPMSLKPVALFFNGLPLGMIFGLVLGYLEGRKHTEALSAVLCASFIISSGVVKSVGRWLIESFGVSEFQMPMLAGLIFLPPLFLAVWVLQTTPPPDDTDRRLRNERRVMYRAERWRFFSAYWPGLSLMVLVYVALTVIRTIRDDFGVEIWRDMGISKTPSVYAESETVVAVCVTALNGLMVLILHNLTAIRVTVGLMCAAFAAIAVSSVMQSTGYLSPFPFMVACGVGMYIPYVAFHTTIFERLIAVSRHPGNLGFLMYIADAMGYLGYAAMLMLRSSIKSRSEILPFFHMSLLVVSVVSLIALVAALLYFHKVLAGEEQSVSAEQPIPTE